MNFVLSHPWLVGYVLLSVALADVAYDVVYREQAHLGAPPWIKAVGFTFLVAVAPICLVAGIMLGLIEMIDDER